MGTADSQTDPDNPLGCLLVQGGLACGTGSENVPFELAARRALTEDQPREGFARAKKDGDLKTAADLAALARYLSAGRHGRDGVIGRRSRSAAASGERLGHGFRRTVG